MKPAGLTLLFCLLFAGLFSQVTLIPTNTSNNLLSISVFSNNIVVAGRDNYLVKSYNECNTLIPLTEPEPVNYQNYLYRVDTSISYMLSTNQAINSYKIYKSTDGCNSWVKKLDTTNLFLNYLKFFDANNGIGIASLYQIVRTTNGGNTWTPIPSPYPLIATSAVEIFGDSTICVGISESFGISKDRGNTWIGSGFVQSNPIDFFFLSKDSILAVSFQGGAYFSKSVNGGSSWQDVLLQNMSEVYGVYFKNVSEGYIVGRGVNNFGVILKTTNFGQNWLSFDTQIQCTLEDIKFLNDSIALVSGTNGVLFKWNSKQAVFTGIKTNSFENLELKLYPNPVKDRVKLEFSFPIPQLNFALQNALGQQLCKGALGPEREIDLRSYAAGVYFLNLYNGTGQKVFKIIKE